MRVRIRKDSKYQDMWIIETKHWWQFGWKIFHATSGDNSKIEARKIAEFVKSPLTLEIK